MDAQAWRGQRTPAKRFEVSLSIFSNLACRSLTPGVCFRLSHQGKSGVRDVAGVLLETPLSEVIVVMPKLDRRAPTNKCREAKTEASRCRSVHVFVHVDFLAAVRVAKWVCC